MPDAVYVLPDPVLALEQYLRLRPELTNLVPAGNIVTQLPSTPTYPYVTIQLAGGDGIWPAFDEPALQVDVWGGLTVDKPTCSLIARTVRAAVWAIRNDIVPAGVLCSSGEEIAPQWLPDPVTTPPGNRFTARYSIILHP